MKHGEELRENSDIHYEIGQGELKSADGVYVFNGDYENDQPKGN